MNAKPKVVIISAELEGNSIVNNAQRTERLRKMLSNLHYSNGDFMGFHYGLLKNNDREETVYVVPLRDSAWETELEVLKDFAIKNFGQKGVIFSDTNRHTEIVLEDSTEPLGVLKSVSKSEAETNGRYIRLQDKKMGKVVRERHYIIERIQ